MPARVTPGADEVKIEESGGVESGDASRMSFVARRKQVVAPNTREQSLRYVRPMSKKNMLALAELVYLVMMAIW